MRQDHSALDAHQKLLKEHPEFEALYQALTQSIQSFHHTPEKTETMSLTSQQLASIKLLAFDYDGVFTDGQIIITTDGHMLRSANARDGFAVAMGPQTKRSNRPHQWR